MVTFNGIADTIICVNFPAMTGKYWNQALTIYIEINVIDYSTKTYRIDYKDIFLSINCLLNSYKASTAASFETHFFSGSEMQIISEIAVKSSWWADIIRFH